MSHCGIGEDAPEAHSARERGLVIQSPPARNGRPIGKRVIQAMEILERLGEASYTEVWEHMQDVCERENASKYMARSVSYGLAIRIGGKPAKYRPAPEWRRWLTETPPDRPEAQNKPRINSVWALGALAGA